MLDYNGVRNRPETESISLIGTSEGSTNSYMDFRTLGSIQIARFSMKTIGFETDGVTSKNLKLYSRLYLSSTQISALTTSKRMLHHLDTRKKKKKKKKRNKCQSQKKVN